MNPVNYALVRSDRKTLAVEVTRDGQVVVRAPLRLSQKRIDAFLAEHQAWIDEHLEIQKKRRENHPEPSEEQMKEYIRMAREVLPGKVQYYSRIMGLLPTGVTITGARKRFGSCSGENRICFSWRLMMYPEEAIDYVVVHELAHIRHKNHSKAFYACVEEVMPDWKERRNLLKE